MNRSIYFPPNDTTIADHRFPLMNVLPYPGIGINLSPRIKLSVE